jgi:pyruvate,orthophosphate dikinase
LNNKEFSSGEYVTIDGTNGRLYFGEPHLTSPTKDVNFMTILQWADKYRTIKVEATIKDSHKFLEEIKVITENIYPKIISPHN